MEVKIENDVYPNIETWIVQSSMTNVESSLNGWINIAANVSQQCQKANVDTVAKLSEVIEALYKKEMPQGQNVWINLIHEGFRKVKWETLSRTLLKHVNNN